MELRNPVALVAYAAATSFFAYTCVYGIRMPIFAAEFRGQTFWDLDLKVAFAMAQTIGIAVGKLTATLYVPSLRPGDRFRALVTLASGAASGLVPIYLGFPGAIQVFGVFISGICLAPIWGIIVMYLEGRGQSEILFAAVGMSPIFAGGFARSYSAYLIQSGVAENTVPVLCASVSLVLFVIIVSFLDKLPPPTTDDIALRNARKPMEGKDRAKVFSSLGAGVWPLIFVYSFLNSFRAFREYFAYEIWSELLGRPTDPVNLVGPEVPIGIFAMLAFACMSQIRSNQSAFFTMLGFIMGGAILISLATELHTSLAIGNMTWTIIVGVGLWIAYVPAGSMIFERLVAMAGLEVTSVFLIYLTDGLGYLSTVVLLQFVNHKKKGTPSFSHLNMFREISYICSFSVIILTSSALLYYAFFFSRITSHSQASHETTRKLPKAHSDSEHIIPETHTDLADTHPSHTSHRPRRFSDPNANEM